MPALTVTTEEIARMIGILDQALEVCRSQAVDQAGLMGAGRT
jgi:hypothetical protein